MSALKDCHHISKFDGTNFTLWKFNMSLVLTQRNLNDFVLGIKKCPAIDDTKTEKERVIQVTEVAAWEKQDREAQFYITANILEKHQLTLANCKSSAEMWTRLLAHKKQSTKDSRQSLLGQFYQLKYQHVESIINYITMVETLAARLKDTGFAVDDDMVMCKILTLVAEDPKYAQVVAAWENLEEERRNIPCLTARLVKEEMRQQSSSAALVNQPSTAFFATRSRQPITAEHSRAPKKFNKHDRQCSYCEKYGRRGNHRDEDCWTKQAYLRGLEESRVQQTASAQQAFSVSFNTESEDFAWNVSTNNTHDPAFWCADSGATHHMTSRREIFIKFRPVVPGVWPIHGIGGKTLYVHGVGEIHVTSLVDQTQHEGVIHEVLFVPELNANLFSISKAAERGFTTVFLGDKVKLVENGKVTMTGSLTKQKLYSLNLRWMDHIDEHTASVQDFGLVSQTM